MFVIYVLVLRFIRAIVIQLKQILHSAIYKNLTNISNQWSANEVQIKPVPVSGIFQAGGIFAL